MKQDSREIFLTTQEAAQLLGISSPKTIKNWLEGGRFPGSVQQADGTWRFSSAYLGDVRAKIIELRLKNKMGDVALPDDLDEDPPPPLL